MKRLFGRRRSTEQALLLSRCDAVLHELRPLCGQLVCGSRRSEHPAYEGWSESAHMALALLDGLRENIAEDQQLGARR